MSWRASCSFRVVASPECERGIQSVRGVGPVALDEDHEPHAWALMFDDAEAVVPADGRMPA
jgi:hypothetical protein